MDPQPPPSPSKQEDRHSARQKHSSSVRCRLGVLVLITLALMTVVLVKKQPDEAPRALLSDRKATPPALQFIINGDEAEPLEFEGALKPLHKPLGRNADKEKFDLTVHQPSKSFGRLKKMWSCEDKGALQGRPKKLVFVHVFKTAGSSMRAVLQAYAHYCNAGIAIVTGCTTVSRESLEHGSWKNDGGRRKGNKCQLKRVQTRDQKIGDNLNSVNTTYLERNIDILAGHLPIGSDQYWKDDEKKHVDVQYITFFRDSVHKYVSSILFKNPDKSIEELVDMIKNRVTKDRKYGKYYERYSSYLITPRQRAEFKGIIELSHNQAANVAMSNLVQKNVIIGITERMSESLELLKYVTDREGTLQEMFEFFGMEDSNGVKKKYVSNKSKASTSDVVTELEKDSKFMEKLREYVKYDEKVRLFALDLHMRQYQWLKEDSPKEIQLRQ